MKTIISLLVINFITFFSFAQFKFKDLKYIDIVPENSQIKFGYNAKLKLINKDCEDCLLLGTETKLIGEWNVDEKTKVEIYFTEGHSDDPSFIVTVNGDIKLYESGSSLHFKGKTIYIEGDANSYFDKKRKFEFNGKTYSEAKQAFYYIGFKGKLNHSITIYKSEKCKEKLARLPKSYSVEIIGGQTRDGNLTKILVKTEFGLVGWFDFEGSDFGPTLIDNFRYNGD